MDREILSTFATEARTFVSVLAKTSSQALDRRLGETEPRISGLQYLILRALCSEQKTIAELSRTFARTPSTLVPAIDALERKALVVRGHDPSDRRRTPLSLTERGRKLLDDVPYVHESDPLVQGLQKMDKEGVERLLALLCAWVVHLPGGQELVQQVEAEIQIHAQPAGKEETLEKEEPQRACHYCWAPDDYGPCPRRRTADG